MDASHGNLGGGGGVNSSDSNEGRSARMGERKMVFVSRTELGMGMGRRCTF